MTHVFRIALALAATGAALASTTEAAPRPVAPASGYDSVVCLFGRAQALGASQAGAAGTARMVQLSKAVAAELDPQRQAIVQENNALQASQRAMPPAQYQQRMAQLNQRADAFARLEQIRNAELRQTRENAEQAIGRVMDPIVTQAFAARHCTVLLERSSAYVWNPAMDLTPLVVGELNRQMPTLNFNLVPPAAVVGQR